MKKLLISIFLMSMLLCGCSQNQSNLSVSSPYEILVKDKMLSYYGEKSDFEKVGFDIVSKALESTLSKRNNVYVNGKGNIRNIVITSKDVTTYRNISVGDNVHKIENNFNHEINLKTSYSVLFDGTREINPKDKSAKQDGFIWINYTTNGETIEKITIYDVLYGKEMR